MEWNKNDNKLSDDDDCLQNYKLSSGQIIKLTQLWKGTFCTHASLYSCFLLLLFQIQIQIQITLLSQLGKFLQHGVGLQTMKTTQTTIDDTHLHTRKVKIPGSFDSKRRSPEKPVRHMYTQALVVVCLFVCLFWFVVVFVCLFVCLFV